MVCPPTFVATRQHCGGVCREELGGPRVAFFLSALSRLCRNTLNRHWKNIWQIRSQFMRQKSPCQSFRKGTNLSNRNPSMSPIEKALRAHIAFSCELRGLLPARSATSTIKSNTWSGVVMTSPYANKTNDMAKQYVCYHFCARAVTFCL